MTDKELQDLLKLKRYEQPDDGFYEQFLQDFHQRRRSELLAGSARRLLLERILTWCSETKAHYWAAGAGLAYGAVTVMLGWSTPQAVDAPVVAHVSMEDVINVSSHAEQAIDDVDTRNMAYNKPLDFSNHASPVRVHNEQLF